MDVKKDKCWEGYGKHARRVDRAVITLSGRGELWVQETGPNEALLSIHGGCDFTLHPTSGNTVYVSWPKGQDAE